EEKPHVDDRHFDVLGVCLPSLGDRRRFAQVKIRSAWLASSRLLRLMTYGTRLLDRTILIE
ncbi:MAG TPA: hypothetical protein VJO33_09850, partial [Gemmatimonadaceae bacterium]|nr:hypothetical protein [Gemmatimonadaceae bacterium]